jgi:hypothetical protein
VVTVTLVVVAVVMPRTWTTCAATMGGQRRDRDAEDENSGT